MFRSCIIEKGFCFFTEKFDCITFFHRFSSVFSEIPKAPKIPRNFQKSLKILKEFKKFQRNLQNPKTHKIKIPKIPILTIKSQNSQEFHRIPKISKRSQSCTTFFEWFSSRFNACLCVSVLYFHLAFSVSCIVRFENFSQLWFCICWTLTRK